MTDPTEEESFALIDERAVMIEKIKCREYELDAGHHDFTMVENEANALRKENELLRAVAEAASAAWDDGAFSRQNNNSVGLCNALDAWRAGTIRTKDTRCLCFDTELDPDAAWRCVMPLGHSEPHNFDTHERHLGGE